MTSVLIVDDEPDIAFVIKKGLERAGFQVHTFNHSEQALRDYRPGKYDLAIVDIKMPKMDGIEFYQKIRELDGNIKVCFITASNVDLEETIRARLPKEVDCFIFKPVSTADLADQIKRVLQG